MLLFYIRHGDPTYTPDALTPKGEQQARALVNRLAKYGLDEIYVSSSNRAIMTAQPTCERLGLTPTVLEWCNESHAYQEFSVKKADGRRQWIFQNPDARRLLTTPEIRALDSQWYKHEAFADLQAEEGTRRILQETDRFMKQLGYRHDHAQNRYIAEQPSDRRIALFAHQGFGFVFLSCLLDIPYPLVCSHLDMGHSGVTVIHFENMNGISIPKILQLSNDSHLYHEGLSTDYQNRIQL